jgi:DnaJ-class molecular chaperone
MDYQDYYQTLGLKRNASQTEIKKAFRKLAREHHPDAKPGDKDAERRFKLINEANNVLADPDKRRKYDALGANWEAYSHADAGPAGGPTGGYGRTNAAGGRPNVSYEFRTSGGGQFSDFFRTFFGQETEPAEGTRGGARGRTATAGPTFEDILSEMGLNEATTGRQAAGGRASGGNGTSRSSRATAEAIAEIDLEEAYHGTVRRVEIDGKRLDVTIPRGADNGTRVKVSGQGPGGGDLVVVVRLRPHPVFTRRGADLERELPITLKEALLGAEVPVTTLKGRVLLKIPPGTQNGRIFRLKGQGMPHLRGDAFGDMLAKVRVLLPTALDPEADKAARAFLELVDQPDPR